MEKYEELSKAVVDHVDGALACGVVDIGSGALLAEHRRPDDELLGGDYLAALARAAAEMFAAESVRRVEQLLGTDDQPDAKVREIFTSSSTAFHFMTAPDQQCVVVMVTDKTTNQGMGWASLRKALSEHTPAAEPS